MDPVEPEQFFQLHTASTEEPRVVVPASVWARLVESNRALLEVAMRHNLERSICRPEEAPAVLGELVTFLLPVLDAFRQTPEHLLQGPLESLTMSGSEPPFAPTPGVPSRTNSDTHRIIELSRNSSAQHLAPRKSVFIGENDGELEDEDDGAPLRINQYIIVKPIGTGSYGTVYQAVSDEDDDDGKSFALKIIRVRKVNIGRSNSKNNPSAMPHKREIAIWKRLEHPNVCPLVEAIHDNVNRCVCLIMPMYQPGPLRINEGDGTATMLDEEHIRSLFLGVVRGMRYLHKHHIAHWDLKPDNVMIDNETGEARVIDFGVSEDVDQSFSGRTPWQRGTPLFWPPEMFDQQSNNIQGFQVDVWSFGVMLYAAAVGRLPYFAKGLEALRNELASHPIEVPQSVSYQLAELITWTLQTEPSRRPTFVEIRAHPFFFLPVESPSHDRSTRLSMAPAAMGFEDIDDEHVYNEAYAFLSTNRQTVREMIARKASHRSKNKAGFSLEPSAAPHA